MAFITEIIPSSNYEVVLYKIASILLVEVTNQIALQGLTENVEVYAERITPFENSEDVLINVSIANANFENSTKRDSTGANDYYVDIYTTGIENNALSGDYDTRNRLHKYTGICRFILADARYKYLDLPAGTIGNVTVNSINFDDTNDRQDASFIRMARITVSVKVHEGQGMDIPIEFTGNDTTIKLSNTDKGQKLIFNT